jgi:hypothetical protein
MKVTILVPNPDRLSAQVHELHRTIGEIHTDQRPCTGGYLSILQTRVAMLRQIEAVHESWIGQWEARLAAAAVRIDDSATRADEIAAFIASMNNPSKWTTLTASSATIALSALRQYASNRGELWDTATENDGSVDAWGWDPDCDSESEMAWRVRIRITKGGAA